MHVIRYRQIMQKWLFIILLFIAYGSPALAADITPPSESPHLITPQDPSTQKPQPDSPPSTHDPGIVKQPETVPHPDSVVTPPVIDPKMAIDPEARTEEERHPQLPPEQTAPIPNDTR